MPDGSCHPPAVPRVRRNREARFCSWHDPDLPKTSRDVR